MLVWCSFFENVLLVQVWCSFLWLGKVFLMWCSFCIGFGMVHNCFNMVLVCFWFDFAMALAWNCDEFGIVLQWFGLVSVWLCNSIDLGLQWI